MEKGSFNWRERTWQKLKSNVRKEKWDLVVVGGGITGAGVLLEATRLGFKVLLVEKNDFAWGSSSRSSKLVHGGLRYLKQGKLCLTRDSVVERELLLDEGKGLVTHLNFLLANYKGMKPNRSIVKIGLLLYDIIAKQMSHKYLDADKFHMFAPHLNINNLLGGFSYRDAQVDDARLVFRVIQEAMFMGGSALNYVSAKSVLRTNGKVIALVVCNEENGETLDMPTSLVINATGVNVNELCQKKGNRLRPLRGSHLIFPAWRFPAAQALTLFHPRDRRPVFVIPWEGVTILGTTDVDHIGSLQKEARIDDSEVDYLMEIVNDKLPYLELSLSDVTSTFSGIRSVLSKRNVEPSKESRDHVIWDDSGLVSITGGKLTTFRKMALELLKTVKNYLPTHSKPNNKDLIFHKVDPNCFFDKDLTISQKERILGRYGENAQSLLEEASSDELTCIPNTKTLWAELKWAARSEAIVKLEDLLLRRVRLGLILPGGGINEMPQIRRICQSELGWSDSKWDQQVDTYLKHLTSFYSLPTKG